ncbi:MAG: carboxylesterase family protein, partial [Myxococcales bacterium]|nr:carboxylesterase family protein [Myxococcales bacterium]
RDGHVLSADAALDAYRQGDYNRVPTILGTNRDEQKLFLLLSSPHVRRIFGVPVALENDRLYEAEARHTSLAWKAMGVDEPASAMRGVQGPSVYGYRFDWDDEPDFLWVDLGRWLGAAHVLEVPFVFGRLSMGRATRLLFDPAREEENLALSRAITSYWTNFAYTGKPGRGREGDLPEWQPWESRGGSFLVLDAPVEERIRMSQETTTRASVVLGVAADPSFETPMERCTVYREFARADGVMDPEEYAGIEEGACLAELGPPSG